MGKNRSPRSNRNTRVLNVNLLTIEREKLIYIPRTFLKVCLRRNRIKAKKLIFLGVAFARICCNYVRFVFKPFFGRNLL